MVKSCPNGSFRNCCDGEIVSKLTGKLVTTRLAILLSVYTEPNPPGRYNTELSKQPTPTGKTHLNKPTPHKGLIQPMNLTIPFCNIYITLGDHNPKTLAITWLQPWIIHNHSPFYLLSVKHTSMLRSPAKLQTLLYLLSPPGLYSTTMLSKVVIQWIFILLSAWTPQ